MHNVRMCNSLVAHLHICCRVKRKPQPVSSDRDFTFHRSSVFGLFASSISITFASVGKAGYRGHHPSATLALLHLRLYLYVYTPIYNRKQQRTVANMSNGAITDSAVLNVLNTTPNLLTEEQKRLPDAQRILIGRKKIADFMMKKVGITVAQHSAWCLSKGGGEGADVIQTGQGGQMRLNANGNGNSNGGAGTPMQVPHQMNNVRATQSPRVQQGMVMPVQGQVPGPGSTSGPAQLQGPGPGQGQMQGQGQGIPGQPVDQQVGWETDHSTLIHRSALCMGQGHVGGARR